MKILLIQLNETSNLYTSSLANSLVKKNHAVNVLLSRRVYTSNYYTPNVNISLVDAPRSYMTMLVKTVNPLTFYRIIRTINKINPDVIHVTNEFLWNLVLFPLLRKYPIVVTVHEPIFRETHGTGNIITTAYFHIEFLSRRFSRKWVNAFIVHGGVTKKILSEYIPTNKIVSIPHGIFFDFKKWKKDDIETEKAVLFFGHIRRDKGLEYLIKAKPKITSMFPDAKVIIAGEGNFNIYNNMIENRENFEIHNRFIRDEEVATFFQRASLVVLPYIGGTQSGVLAVAYAFGKPMVVTSVGNLPEYVDDGKTGFIVPPRDVDALADAIIKLLKNDKLREEMGENIYRKMEKEFSWNEIAEKTIEGYEKVIWEKEKELW